jgi:C-terminal processing protease CtpA/Prc
MTLLFLLISSGLTAQTRYEKDFAVFWKDVKENYAYLDQEKINWDKVKEIYQPKIADVSNKEDFISLMEKVINELHNGHISLNMNLKTSNRIIPSGSDMLVSQVGNRFLITDLRKNFPAERSGLKVGMEVVQFNRRRVAEQLPAFLPLYTHDYTSGMYSYALGMLFAGTHNRPREITVMEYGQPKTYYPDRAGPEMTNAELIESRILNGNTGYIKLNNSLGNIGLITAFDSVLLSMMHCKALILDLTETPGGGTSTVARAIMGRFTEKELPYQKHELEETPLKIRRSWVEYVSPRRPVYRKKLLVMVGHWTGSMGEGMAIGFDAMKAGTIVGTRMAGLLGAISSFSLPNTNISYQIPTERLYHIDGTPRENFIPRRLTGNIYETWQLIIKMLDQ